MPRPKTYQTAEEWQHHEREYQRNYHREYRRKHPEYVARGRQQVKAKRKLEAENRPRRKYVPPKSIWQKTQSIRIDKRVLEVCRQIAQAEQLPISTLVETILRSALGMEPRKEEQE